MKPLLLVFAIGLVGSCKRDKSAPAPPPIAEPQDNLEAADAVAVIRAYWTYGQMIEQAGWDADGCYDKAKAFDELRSCHAKARDEVVRLKGLAPKGQLANLPCGRDIEAVHKKHADDVLSNVTKTLDWLDAHHGLFRRLMIGRTIGDACELPRAPCGDKPVEVTAPYQPINEVRCIERLVVCGRPCIYSVAGALGMPTDPPMRADGVTVRSTGKVIR